MADQPLYLGFDLSTQQLKGSHSNTLFFLMPIAHKLNANTSC